MGRRTLNSLPFPRPSLRASTVPPCNSTSRFTSVRPIPKPPWDRSIEPIDLREHVEDAIEHLGGDADPGIGDGYDGLGILSFGRQHDAAAAGHVLRGVIEQIGDDLSQPRRIGLQHDGLLWNRDLELVPCFVDEPVGPCPQHFATMDESSTARFAQLHRAASDAIDIQQVVDQPHHLLCLPLHRRANFSDQPGDRRRPAASAPARCESERVDFAARVPAVARNSSLRRSASLSPSSDCLCSLISATVPM